MFSRGFQPKPSIYHWNTGFGSPMSNVYPKGFLSRSKCNIYIYIYDTINWVTSICIPKRYMYYIYNMYTHSHSCPSRPTIQCFATSWTKVKLVNVGPSAGHFRVAKLEPSIQNATTTQALGTKRLGASGASKARDKGRGTIVSLWKGLGGKVGKNNQQVKKREGFY